MRICDCCKIVGKPVLDLKLTLIKPDPENARKNPEEIRGSGMEICNDCIPLVWDKLTTVLTDQIKMTEELT